MTTVFSYGAGVQSRAILQLVALGRLPKPDLVVFADLKAEPSAVYKAVEEDAALCASLGIPFSNVVADLRKHLLTDRPDRVYVPAFTMDDKGKRGMLTRTCTKDFKIRPIHREVRRFFREQGIRFSKKNRVTLWTGISTDEAARATPARVQWVDRTFPLIDLGLSRSDCEDLLAVRGIQGAKSACVFCPYGSGRRTEQLWREDRPAFEMAVEMDEALRNRRRVDNVEKHVAVFIHPSLRPLREIGQALEREQAIDDATVPLFPDLFENDCEGACGL